MPIESLFQDLGEPAGEPWCLAFSNTVSSRGEPGQQDRIQSMEALRGWLAKQLILDGDAPNIGEDPRILERAIRLREAIYSVGSALASRLEPSEDDVSELNWNVQRGIVAAKLEPGNGRLNWDLESQRSSMAGCLGLLALSAANLYTSERAQRVRLCNNPTCGWLFLDLSKNHSRKWCDMADCGNVAKARRYYAKQKALKAVNGKR